MSKLGGELEEEKQLNKSLRENQEEWQVPQKKRVPSLTSLLSSLISEKFSPGPDSGAADASKEG